MNELHNFPEYYDMCFKRPESLEPELELISAELNNFNVKKVLDICCGTAYHAIYLAKNGFTSWGLDSNKRMIRYAMKLSKKDGVKINFITADMCDFVSPIKFDACVNSFGSFGYLHTENSAMSHLNKVKSCLKRGGIYFLILRHPKHDLARVENLIWETESNSTKIRVVENKSYDPLTKLLTCEEKYTFYRGKMKKVIHNLDLRRVWGLKEVKKLAADSGFKTLKVYDLVNQKHEWTNEPSQNMVVLLQKAS